MQQVFDRPYWILKTSCYFTRGVDFNVYSLTHDISISLHLYLSKVHFLNVVFIISIMAQTPVDATKGWAAFCHHGFVFSLESR